MGLGITIVEEILKCDSQWPSLIHVFAMETMLLKHILSLRIILRNFICRTLTFFLFWSSSAVFADEYSITAVGDAASAAIQQMGNQLDDADSGVTLSFLPNIAPQDELLEFLDSGFIDIAVVSPATS